MLAATVGAMLLGADGLLGRAEGAVLLSGLAAVTWSQLRRPTVGPAEPGPQRPANPRRGALLRDAAFVASGLATLTLGARWLVGAAAAGAVALGVSELVVGLTLVAAGTSVPELATSVVAALRGERDLAIGNVVGSNVFNLLGILGVAALASPAGLPIAEQTRSLDAWVALAAAAVLLPMAWSGAAIVRWEGAVLLVAYAGYLMLVIALAVGALPLPGVGATVLLAALPVAVITVAALVEKRRARP
jgi:cation:H+ antiporter